MFSAALILFLPLVTSLAQNSSVSLILSKNGLNFFSDFGHTIVSIKYFFYLNFCIIFYFNFRSTKSFQRFSFPLLTWLLMKDRVMVQLLLTTSLLQNLNFQSLNFLWYRMTLFLGIQQEERLNFTVRSILSMIT